MNDESIHRLMYCYGDNSQYDFASKFLVPEEQVGFNIKNWVGKEVEFSYSIQFYFDETDGIINICSPLVPRGWKVSIMPDYYKQCPHTDKILIFTSFPYEKDDVYNIYQELRNNELQPVVVLYNQGRNFASSDYLSDKKEDNISLSSKIMSGRNINNVIISDSDSEISYYHLFSVNNNYIIILKEKILLDLQDIDYRMEGYDYEFDIDFEEYKDAFSLENIADNNNKQLFNYSSNMKKIGVWQVLSDRYRQLFVECDDGIKHRAIELFNDFFEDKAMCSLVENNILQKIDKEFENYFYTYEGSVLVSTELEYMLLDKLRIEFRKIATDFINKGVRNCIKSELFRNIGNIKSMIG